MSMLNNMLNKAKESAQAPKQVKQAIARETKANTAQSLSSLIAKSKIKTLAKSADPEDNMAAINKIRALKENAPAPKASQPVDSTLAKLPETETVTTLSKLNEIAANEVPEDLGITWDDLDDSQKAAITLLEHEQFGCITGAAGTGKTTITKILISRLVHKLASVDMNHYIRADREAETRKPEKLAPAIAICAFTGRATEQAKKNMPTKYHSSIMTIHALLGFYPEFFEDEIEDSITGKKMVSTKRRFIPWYDEHNKLPWKVIVIDEAGMVPLPLWEQLWAACKPDTRIIMIGDINQLPPVQGRSVFGFALNTWPSAELTHIHRQKGKDNPIVDNAWRVLQGKYPKPGKGFMAVDVDKITVKDILGKVQQLEGSKHAGEVLKRYVLAMSEKNHFNAETDAIIVPQNGDKPGSLGYDLGQIPLNAFFCLRFNPPPEKNNSEQITGRRVIIQAGYETKHFAIGDKVMVTKNDRDRGLTNGMVGRVIDINVNGESDVHSGAYDALSVDDLSAMLMEVHESGHDAEETTEEYNKRASSHVVTVNFGETLEGVEVIESFATVGQVNSLMLAYAITCHKSQGGEYPTVVIMCHSSNHRLLYREWLYTAITRAQGKVVLLYNNKGLSQALRRQKIKGKSLKEKAQEFIEWSGAGLGPDLPVMEK